ncbi:MAG: guanine deaminase [Muribaculaceae bacterium]|nr:guanine deaminase [Muribaculaceae bacterium]
MYTLKTIPLNPEGGNLSAVRGAVLTFKADPFLNNEDECYDYIDDALVVIQDGHIVAAGPYRDVYDAYGSRIGAGSIDHYENSLILPGFIDCHIHYVQTPMIGSFGDTLLNWLNEYTFPTESRFNDKKFADEVARIFFRQLLSQGTTTANVFATTFAESVDAFFEESERYNTRMISGKVLQDRNLPDSLRDPDTEQSVVIAEELLRKWHNRGRQLYAVVPRFAPTSTPRQLELAGDLYRRYIDTGVYMHTHLDEVQSEIDWVTQLFPDQPNYTEVYRHFGLIDRRSVLAHCCIVRPEEWQVLHDSDCGVAHCPSSNLFLGDGEFKFWEAKDATRPLRTGMATDVGGGTNFSILRQLGEAYKVAMLNSRSLTAMRAFYMATRGAAEVLHLENTIGSVAPGYEADLAVLDLQPSEFAAWRMQFAENIRDRLFVLMTLGLNNVNRATYVAGRRVYDRDRDHKWLYADEL